MAYEPTIWKDRAIERPKTFNIVNNPDGTATLVPVTGAVAEPGTPVNAANLNKLEQAVKTHEADNMAHWILIDTVETVADVLQLDLNIPTGYSSFYIKVSRLKSDDVGGGRLSIKFNNNDATGFVIANTGIAQKTDMNITNILGASSDPRQSELYIYINSANDLKNNPIIDITADQGWTYSYERYFGRVRASAVITTINFISTLEIVKIAAGAKFEIWGR